ncbi:3-dehydroquinate synthase [Candidatus Pelagibacter sp.]|nr:3-dehydroquinate synthase [Candidatus Pelagibacter sp.]MDA9663291.1 3-dehydroquinate synthase [Candidatus Pelagibacter sp.]
MKKTSLKVRSKNHEYKIIIGNNLLVNFETIIKKNSVNFNKCLIVVDNNVPKNKLKKLKIAKNKKKIFYIFKSSEKNKNQKNTNKILDILLKENFYRNDCLISVGGGITGDVCGYAASIFKRGLKFINIPTTLLSQVDSSIGGKTGINTNYGKNLIGSFYQPSLVISDSDFLKTLPKREIICGYAEILKHSILSNKEFFLFLNKHAQKIMDLNNSYIHKAIYKSCLIKKEIVEIDENEKNIRKILNLGHTFAHAYEASLNFSKKLNHGEAVLLGLNTILNFSLQKKILKKNTYDLIMNHLLKFNLPNKVTNYLPNKNIKEIISYMKKDKKNDSDKINLILIKDIGKIIYNLNFNKKEISLFLKKELAN